MNLSVYFSAKFVDFHLTENNHHIFHAFGIPLDSYEFQTRPDWEGNTRHYLVINFPSGSLFSFSVTNEVLQSYEEQFKAYQQSLRIEVNHD